MDLSCESIIIEKAKQGSAQAWAILFKRNFKPVYNLCLQLTMKNVEDAEDVTQQTFIVAAKKISKFNPRKGSFRQWLFGIAKNCYKKHMSKKAKHMHFDIDNPGTESFAESKTECSEKILVLETLARLPAKYRIVLEAKYLEKKTVNEIACDHNTTSKAVESRLTRAREKFRLLYQALIKKEFEI